MAVVLVSFQEKPEHVKRTVRERGYLAPVLIDQSAEVTGIKYGVWGPPTLYFIDRNGRLLARGVGARDWKSPAVRTLIQALLASK